MGFARFLKRDIGHDKWPALSSLSPRVKAIHPQDKSAASSASLLWKPFISFGPRDNLPARHKNIQAGCSWHLEGKNLPMFPTAEPAPLYHNKTSVTTSENNSYRPAGSFRRIGEINKERKIIKTEYKPNELHCNGSQNWEDVPLFPLHCSRSHFTAKMPQNLQIQPQNTPWVFSFPYKCSVLQTTKIERSHWDSLS